ncbi:hypothetical protein JB92DRAFT_2700283, partial [Gautieria morchelliformis]
TLVIPILPLDTYEVVWGDDAEEFRPERWQHIPEKIADIPGVYSGIMTLLKGPRHCYSRLQG